MITHDIAIKALFFVAFLTSVVALILMRREYLRYIHENDILKKKLRNAKRKLEQWKRGWGPENQHILDALNDAFLLIHVQGKIMFSNRKADDLFQTSELEGTSLADYNGNPVLLHQVQKAMKGEKPYTSEFSLSDPQNSGSENKTYWYIDAAPVAGADKYRRVLIRDITIQYQTEQVRKDFVANASHELRTPMTIILGYLESLREEGFIREYPELADKFLSVMFKHGLRVNRIVEDMLVISRLESGHEMTLKEKPFSLYKCITDVFGRLESIAEKQQAEMTATVSPRDIRILGDRYYWVQIFFNLIENALKHNPSPGLKINVGAKITSEDLRLWVADNGTGIPASHLPYIFKRFYRVQSSEEEEIKGTGLGLSIVKRAVEAHDGTIEIYSIPGRETKFRISLPLSRIASDPSKPADLPMKEE